MKISPQIYVGLEFKPHMTLSNDITNAINDALRISFDKLSSTDRHMDIKEARHIAIALIRAKTGMSLKHIGSLFNRDHSTVISSIRVYANLYGRDPKFTAKADKVKARIFEKL